MSDMKTALSRVIDEWENKEKPEPQSNFFKTTTGVTRATFDCVRANPGITRSEAYRLLEKQGYSTASTASLLTAFIRQGQMEYTDGKLFTTSNEYKSIKTSKTVRSQLAKARAAAKANAKPVESRAGIAALQPQATPAPRSALITTNFSVENTIKHLTIYQAKELRDALNNLFR